MTFLEGGGIMKTIRSFFIPSAGRSLRLAGPGIKTVCGLSAAAQSLIIQPNEFGSGIPERLVRRQQVDSACQAGEPGDVARAEAAGDLPVEI